MKMLMNNKRITEVHRMGKKQPFPKVADDRQMMSKVKVGKMVSDLRIDHSLLIKTDEQAIDVIAVLDVAAGHSVETVVSPCKAA